MGRKLQGPVKIGKSPTYYARLTVPPKDRDRAGQKRLTRSLQTTDIKVALERWADAYKALQQELSLRLSTPITDHDLIRARIDAGYADDTKQYGREFNPDFTDQEKAEQILNVRELDPTNALHLETFKAVESGSLVTWQDLLDNHCKITLRKKGKPLSDSTIQKTKNSINSILGICPYPSSITKKLVKEMVNKYEREGKKASTTSSNLTLLQTIVNSGIKYDLLDFEKNPFELVDFAAKTNEDDERKEFTLEQIKILINDAEYGGIFRLMIGTGLRIGEICNRNIDKDINNGMLIIRANPELKWKPKSQSSWRRVPIDAKAEKALRAFYAEGFKPDTNAKNLRTTVRNYFDDPLLVVHSCRHSFKTLARMNQLDIAVSDEISGHAKVTVSKTADGYGSYPDELLKQECKKVYDYIDKL
jgi:integrase